MFLDYVDKGGNSFCEHPMVLIKELLKCQAKHVRITNERLFNMSEEMKVERVKLALEPQTNVVLYLMQASKCLNKPIFERYKGFQKRALHELYLVRGMHPDTKEICIMVKSSKTPDSKPRILFNTNQRCHDCIERLNENSMCSYKILVKRGFYKSLFEPRHMLCDQVEGSLHGWTPHNTEVIDSLVGYNPEEITDTYGVGDLETGTSHSVGIFEVTADLVYFDDDPGTLPAGYVHDYSVKLKPLTKKQVENITYSMVNLYSGYSNKRKYEISKLVVQLQELTTFDAD